MFGQLGKPFFLGLIIACLIGPVALMIWNAQIGTIAFVLGLMIAVRCLSLLRTIQLEGTLQDQQALHRQQNHAQTIFVQMIDDDGNELAPEAAQAKIAVAQLRAGPRDMVVGVRRKVP